MHLAVFQGERFFWTPTVSLCLLFCMIAHFILKKDVRICVSVLFVCGSFHLFLCNREPESNARFVSRRCQKNEKKEKEKSGGWSGVKCITMSKATLTVALASGLGVNSSLGVSHLSESYYTLMHYNNNLWLQ